MKESESKVEKSLVKAVNNMRQYEYRAYRDVKTITKFAKKEQSATEKKNSFKEASEFEHVEKEIARFLGHTARVMRDLIVVLKDEDAIDSLEHFGNKYKDDIGRDLTFLVEELRALDSLNHKS